MSSKNDGTENAKWKLNKVQFRPPSCFSVCFVTVPILTLKVGVGRGGYGYTLVTLKADFFLNEKWKKVGKII